MMSWYPTEEVEDCMNDLKIENDVNNNNDDYIDGDISNNNNDDFIDGDNNNNKDNNAESPPSHSLVQDIISEFGFQEFNTIISELNDSNISESSNENNNDNADTSHECESVELLNSTSEFSLNANAPDFTFKQFDGYRGNSAHLISSCLNSDIYRY